jgi:OmcA/MtrC family decaheme c-type cytochrome
VRDATVNPVFSFPVTGELEPRRMIVADDKCNTCHNALALHGGQRVTTGGCVACHQPGADDAEVRPADQLPAQSIHFKWLIHRLHRGEELTQDFTVYGFRSSVHNYNEVVFPGLLNYCEACHEPGTYSVPVAEGALPTITERDYYSPMLPAAAACLACHDNVDAAAHAFVNTAVFGESCGTCHGEDKEFDVVKVHAH